MSKFNDDYPKLAMYAMPPKPDGLKPMSQVQSSAMTFMCGTEAKQKTGYDPVPIEELREDVSILKLLDMLEYCRPGGSDDEEAFIEHFIAPHNPHRDDYGNHFIEVPTPEDHPRILWSCHTDTVHRHGGLQKVEVTSGIAWTSNGSCLGSDDTIGIWMALEMIQAKVPGTYVFHRDEESGGQGSSWLAREGEEFLGSFDAAIALDRAGYFDVITYQGGQRCCSDEFAKSLAAAIGGGFKPDDSGVFTDTANYVDLIGECTNLSVGYFKQHGVMEHTNLGFASRMRDALLAADFSKLVIKRKPGEVDNLYGNYDWNSRWDYDSKFDRKPKKATVEHAYSDDTDRLWAMEEYVKEFPWVVAEYLIELGVEIDDLDVYEPGDLSKGGRR